MARVTVEDCIKIIESRFELILVASQRARTLSKGVEPLIDRDRDKNPVVALREIAEEKLDLDETKEDLVKGLQKYHEEVLTEPEEENSANSDIDGKLEQIDDDVLKDLESNANDAGLSIDDTKE